MTWLALRAALAKYWPAIVLGLLLIGSHTWAYHKGTTAERATWQAQWAQRDADDEQRRADAEIAARIEERRRQDWAAGVQADATQALEKLRTDAAGADSDNRRLRDELARLQTRLSGASKNTAAPVSSASATRAAMVLSDMYGSCQGRLAEVSEAFDGASIAGRACERFVDGLSR